MSVKEILQAGLERVSKVVDDVKRTAEASAYANLVKRLDETSNAVINLARTMHMMTQLVARHERVLGALIEQLGLDDGPPMKSTLELPSLSKKDGPPGSDKPN